jgi:hypothetical protein
VRTGVVVHPAPAQVARDSRSARDWFLQDSKWEDSQWLLAPTNLLEEEDPQRIRWDFVLPSGGRFSDPKHAALLETAKKLIALVPTRSLYSGLPRRARTACGYFLLVRSLLCWMDQEGFGRFAEIDPAAVLRYRHALSHRPSRRGTYILPTTQLAHLSVLAHLYALREELGDGLPEDPFIDRNAHQLAGASGIAESGRHTPDVIAVPLVQNDRRTSSA